MLTGERLDTLARKSSSSVISESEIHHFKSFCSSFTICINWFYSFKANLTLLKTLSGHLFFPFHNCIFKECFKKIWYYDLFSLAYVESKQQICCQGEFFNALIVLKMNQDYASILIDFTACNANETSRVDFCVNFFVCLF